jgi:tRNA nucleotidyltransferase (CCA-adding enzyme)
MKDYVETGREILRKLTDRGYEAYFVGGFVRDFLLHAVSSDIDIATSASPSQVAEVFPDAKPTGLKYGTVTVFSGSHGFEITTFRSEGSYRDARHPDAVDFGATLEKDLERRDFSINAIAMAADGRIVDRFGGREDLERHVLRAIGNPEERFREDALRILRAFRFVAKLDFEIDEATFAGIVACRSLLARVSNERILSELKYIVRSPHADKAYRAMVSSGVLEVLRPIAAGVRLLAERGPVRLSFEEFAALSFRLGAGVIPSDWKLSNRERQTIDRIMTLADVTAEGDFDELLVYVNGLDLCLAANRVNAAIDPRRNQEDRIRALHAAMPIHATCELKFKGDDILASTPLRDARKIGGIIDELVLMVITGQLDNEYEPLRAHALALIGRMGEHDDGRP